MTRKREIIIRRPPSSKTLPEVLKSRSSSSVGASENVQQFHLMNFEVTWEPLNDPEQDALPDSVKARIPKLHALIQKNPEKALPEVRELAARHPKVLMFTNWLVTTLRLGSRRDQDEGLALSEKLFHEHPEYFFARTTYAEYLIERDRLEDAGRLMFGEGKILTQLYPDRKVFHISEIRHWAIVSAKIKIGSGQPDVAKSYRDILHKLEPNSPAVKYLDHHLNKKSGLFSNLLRDIDALAKRKP